MNMIFDNYYFYIFMHSFNAAHNQKVKNMAMSPLPLMKLRNTFCVKDHKLKCRLNETDLNEHHFSRTWCFLWWYMWLSVGFHVMISSLTEECNNRLSLWISNLGLSWVVGQHLHKVFNIVIKAHRQVYKMNEYSVLP